MLHVRLRGGGSGRYHSRAVIPPRPPRPPPAASGAAPRPPPAGASAGAAASGAPPPPPAPNAPPMLRCIVFAPPLPMISYMRSIPLWFELMNPRYPGDHISTNACVHTPGMPYEIILVISNSLNHGSSA